jgi:hypothetical protein
MRLCDMKSWARCEQEKLLGLDDSWPGKRLPEIARGCII